MYGLYFTQGISDLGFEVYREERAMALGRDLNRVMMLPIGALKQARRKIELHNLLLESNVPLAQGICDVVGDEC